MRLDLFRKKSVKPTDNSAGLEVVPTEAVPESLPEVVQPSGESYPEVVSVNSVSPDYKSPPAPNRDVTLEVPFHNSPEFDQPGLEVPSRDIPPFTHYASQSQSPPQQQQSPPQDSSRIDPPTTYPTIVPSYQPPQIHPTQGGPVIRAPSLWEHRHEPGTNRPYYINHTTKATSWFLPQGDLLESQVDLPPGWEMRFTHDGQRYFLEHATGAVSFKDPRVFKRPTFLQAGQKTPVKRNHRTGEPLGKLPPGWTRKVDTIGRAYFVDTSGKIISFEDPRSGQVEFERGRALPPETVLYA